MVSKEESNSMQVESAISIQKFELALNENNRKVYYISDIHINHKIAKRFPNSTSKKEIGQYIKELVRKIVQTAGEVTNSDYLLVAGDVSYNFEVSRRFYKELVKVWDAWQIVVVLGNHELWNYNINHKPLKKVTPLTEVINQYRCMFKELGITFLQNELLVCKPFEKRILKEDELQDIEVEKLRKLCMNSSLVILGGIGYSGYNKEFNAIQGIYRQAITSISEDYEETEKFERIYLKVVKAINRKQIIVLTHMPKENWTQQNYNSNWIYVNGHTHRNDYIESEEGRVYSDNQIGYKNDNMGLKYFKMTYLYDVFAYYEDGIYEITREQYLDFNRGIKARISFNRLNCAIYMLKRNGLYCFILENLLNKEVYLLNGGAIKKLDYNIQYYYDNLIKYANAVKQMMEDYNCALREIAQRIKAIGGDGKIHGCIVDIDFYNHIYLNPYDGMITPYYASDVTRKQVFPSVQRLLQKKRADLYQNYLQLLETNGKKELLDIYDNIVANDEMTMFVKNTSMYKPSRIIKALQYITDVNVVRVWYDGLLDMVPCVEEQKTKRK